MTNTGFRPEVYKCHNGNLRRVPGVLNYFNEGLKKVASL